MRGRKCNIPATIFDKVVDYLQLDRKSGTKTEYFQAGTFRVALYIKDVKMNRPKTKIIIRSPGDYSSF